MKKFVCVFLVLLITCVIMISCTDTNLISIQNSISEERKNVFVGETDNFLVNFMTGRREQEYVINGYKTNLIDFGVVTFTIKNMTIKDEDLSVIVNINGTEYEEILEENPFDGTLVCDIKTTAENYQNIIVTLISKDFKEECKLKNLNTEWKIKGKDALKVAYKNYKRKLKKFIKNGEFEGETYIKILNNTSVSSEDYLWYVNFVCRNGKNYACIIDTNSNKILAKRENSFKI